VAAPRVKGMPGDSDAIWKTQLCGVAKNIKETCVSVICYITIVAQALACDVKRLTTALGEPVPAFLIQKMRFGS